MGVYMLTLGPLEKLIKNTGSLYSIYNALISTYCPVNNFTQSPQKIFAELIDRADKVIQSADTGRNTERNSLLKLITELKEYKDSANTAQVKTATLILLGGLIHRLLRLENAWGGLNSDLYKAIREVLLLTENNKLDKITITNALASFKVYITEKVYASALSAQKREIMIPRYKTYPHLASDQFLEKLDTMMQENYCVIEKKPFFAINFLESLAAQLQKDFSWFNKELDEWFAALKKEKKDFSKNNFGAIQTHLDNYCSSKNKPSKFKQEIVDIFFSHLMQKREKADFESFVADIQQAHLAARIMTLHGGYIYLLYQGKKQGDTYVLHPRDIPQLLISRLKTAVDRDTNDLEYLRLSTKFLYHYLFHRQSDEDFPELNCEFFDGGAMMFNGLIQLTEAISASYANKVMQEKRVNTFVVSSSLF